MYIQSKEKGGVGKEKKSWIITYSKTVLYYWIFSIMIITVMQLINNSWSVIIYSVYIIEYIGRVFGVLSTG